MLAVLTQLTPFVLYDVGAPEVMLLLIYLTLPYRVDFFQTVKTMLLMLCVLLAFTQNISRDPSHVNTRCQFPVTVVNLSYGDITCMPSIRIASWTGQWHHNTKFSSAPTCVYLYNLIQQPAMTRPPYVCMNVCDRLHYLVKCCNMLSNLCMHTRCIKSFKKSLVWSSCLFLTFSCREHVKILTRMWASKPHNHSLQACFIMFTGCDSHVSCSRKVNSSMFSHCEALSLEFGLNVRCEAEKKTNSEQRHKVQQNMNISL